MAFIQRCELQGGLLIGRFGGVRGASEAEVQKAREQGSRDLGFSIAVVALGIPSLLSL